MTTRYEMYHHEPVLLIFDIEDRYARDRGTRGPHPRPLGTIRYHLIARQDGDLLRPYDPPLELVTVRNASGYDLCFGKVRLPDGAVRQRVLAPGPYTVR